MGIVIVFFFFLGRNRNGITKDKLYIPIRNYNYLFIEYYIEFSMRNNNLEREGHFVAAAQINTHTHTLGLYTSRSINCHTD